MGDDMHGAAAGASLIKFNFYGDELDVATTSDGEHWVGLRRLCEPLGVDEDGQRRKLLALPWACAKIILAHDASGRNQDIFCLNIRSVAGWLFSVNAGKVRPELREKLVRYQRECAEVLADHFLGRRGVLPEGAASKEEVQRLHLRYATKLSQAETEKRALCEDNRRLQGELDRALDASSALIAERDVQKIKRERDAVASMMVRLGRCKKPNMASGRLTVHNRVMNRWLGAGKTIEGMPREYVAEVLAMLHVLKRELEAECKRRNVETQTNLFGLFTAEARRQQPN